MKERLYKAISQVADSSGLSADGFVVEYPGDFSHGDYATNVALVAAKKAGENPREVAESIVTALTGNIEGVERVEVAGPGFINFYLARDVFGEVLKEAQKDSWGKNNLSQGQRVMVEYTDPNPFKEFHIGHLMANTVGESLARLVESSGAEVVRANYQGDIGPHVAKCLWGVMKENLDPNDVKALGTAYVVGAAAYENDPQAKAEIDDINKRLYQGDDALKPLYDAGRAASLSHFEELYKILGTKFDHYFFESEVGPIGVEVVKEGLKQGVFEESEGAVIYRGEKVGLHTRVFITKMGTPTYETKELGLDKTKFEKEKLDQSFIITANEQDGFFKVVLAAMAEVLPLVAERTRHISHGLMVLPTGKMGSRKGNVITGESLIGEMRDAANEKMEGRDLGDLKASVADAVAVAAIKFEILKQGTGKNIVFDPVASLSFEGDSGPYLQYTHARIGSVSLKAEQAGVTSSFSTVPEELYLPERLLIRFPEIVLRALEEREPHYVATYLIELAGAFNTFYAQERIADATDTFAPYKLGLSLAVKNTLKNGLMMLGIQAPERM